MKFIPNILMLINLYYNNVYDFNYIVQTFCFVLLRFVMVRYWMDHFHYYNS